MQQPRRYFNLATLLSCRKHLCPAAGEQNAYFVNPCYYVLCSTFLGHAWFSDPADACGYEPAQVRQCHNASIVLCRYLSRSRGRTIVLLETCSVVDSG